MEMYEPSFGDKFTVSIGWTPDKFSGYLYKYKCIIWIAVVRSVNRCNGDFSRFFKSLVATGYIVKIVDPFMSMEKICIRWGLTPSVENFNGRDRIIWTKMPQKLNGC